ncbi:hypothetical protein EDB19DRAFT_540023 [Suillus lakei]|nr:hypothetical protein EDB19DRAFT_540023 [Suillus lakei]
MSHPWSTKRHASRSPAPNTTPTSPAHRFLPPSHYAAAAGVPYSANRSRAHESRPPQPYTSSAPPLPSQSSLASASDSHTLNTDYSTNFKSKRRSQVGDLGLMEAHLLPSLKDTIDRMTRPSSQLQMPSPLPNENPQLDHRANIGQYSSSHPRSKLARTTQLSSTSYPSSYSKDTSHQLPVAQSEGPPRPSRSALRQKPKPILKAQPRTPTMIPSDRLSDRPFEAPRPAGLARSGNLDWPSSMESFSPRSALPHKQKTQPLRQPSITTNIGSSRRTERARARTDPGAPNNPAPSTSSLATPQPKNYRSNIPRRVAPPLLRHTPRESSQDSLTDAEPQASSSLRGRKLAADNNFVFPSSSSESDETPVMFPKQPSFTQGRVSASKAPEKKKERFGLGFGFADYGAKLRGMFADNSAHSIDSSTSDGGSARNDDGSIQDNESLFSDRADQGNLQGDSTISDRYSLSSAGSSYPGSETMANGDDSSDRRKRELLGLVDGLNPGTLDHPTRSEESEYFGEEGLAIGGSSESIHVPNSSSWDESSKNESDSDSEYSFDNENDEGLRSSTPRDGHSHSKVDKTCSKDDQVSNRWRFDEQHARNTGLSVERPSSGHPLLSPRRSVHPTYLNSKTSHASPENAPNANIGGQRYSSELSRMMVNSDEAAARERQAFGLSTSSPGSASDEPCLTHADSDMSSIAGNTWQFECEDDGIHTDSLLNRLATQEFERSMNAQSTQSDLSYASSESSVSAASMSSVAHEFLHSDRINAHRDRQRSSANIHESWEDFRQHILEQFGEVEVRRQEIIWKLAESEATFVTNLQNMVQLFILPLRVRSTKVWVSGVPDDVSKLFDWLEDIVHLHTKLSASLIGVRDVHISGLKFVGEILRPFVAKLEIYQPYLVKLEFVATRIEHLVVQEKSDIGDFIKLQERSSACQGWSLEKYLVEPVHRLSQYPDFFHRLWHATPKSHPDYLSTLSVLHSAKLTIRVLSEVKDREDEYEFVKDMLSHIQNVPSQLPCRDRRLLMHGPVACARVENDDLPIMRPSTNLHGFPEPPKSPSPDSRPRHNERLSNALKGWRGRSGSVQSTASTAASMQSFRTAPSSFDFRSEPQAGSRNSPSLRVESPAVDVQLFVFTDLIMMASATNHHDGSQRTSADLHILNDFGLSRILSVTDETDRRSSISLDLVPLAAEELERGYVNSKGRVLTVSLSHGTSRSSVSEASMQCVVLKEWLVPLRQSCQHTLRSLSSPSVKSHLAHASKESEISQSVLSILASGLPFPKSPSMQLHSVEQGQAGDTEQQEREERGWWSLRFHEVLREIQRREVALVR